MVQWDIMGGSEVDQELVAHVSNKLLPPLLAHLLETARNNRLFMAEATYPLLRVKSQPFDNTILNAFPLKFHVFTHGFIVPGPIQ